MEDSTRRDFMRRASAVALMAEQVVAQNSTASATGMPTRVLGRTGQRVSIVALGGWYIGAVKDDAEATRIMHAAIDEGQRRLPRPGHHAGLLGCVATGPAPGRLNGPPARAIGDRGGHLRPGPALPRRRHATARWSSLPAFKNHGLLSCRLRPYQTRPLTDRNQFGASSPSRDACQCSRPRSRHTIGA